MLKYRKDGKVAVVLSKDRDFYWGSVVTGKVQEKLLFDYDLVGFLLGEKSQPDEVEYWFDPDEIAWEALDVVWVPEGERFYVGIDSEGYEYIVHEKHIKWVTA